MSFLRTHIENRNIFMLMLITLLCMTIVIAATASWWGVLWEKVQSAGTFLTFWQTAESVIKSLDEKITDLKVKISELQKKQDDSWKEYEKRGKEVEDREKRAKTAADNLAAAQAATEAAQQTKTQAKSAYDASVQAEYQAYLDWNGYTCDSSRSECSKCTTDVFCYEKDRLHSQWQQSKKQLDKDKKALDAAETALTEKQEAEEEADKKLKAAVKLVETVKMHRDWSYHDYCNARDKKASKIAELIRKETEYAEKLSEVELAKTDFQTAVTDLRVIQETYPTEWAATLAADPALASRIDELFSQAE